MPQPVSLTLELHVLARAGCRRRRGAGRRPRPARRAAVAMVTRPRPGMRIARVEHQVDQHLLELPAVGPDLARVRRRARSSSTWSSPSDAAQHLLEVPHHAVDRQHLGAEELLAGEGEELAGDVGGAGARLDDLLHLGPARVVGLAGSRSRNSLKPMTPVIMLLTSCATPPARRPAACIRSARRSCSSTRLRSVTSR